VTLVVEEAQTQQGQVGEVPESALPQLAAWRVRAGAFAVDVFPGAAVVATMALVSTALPARGVWWWVCIVVLGLAILLLLANRTVLPALTGWSLGRGLFGTVVTRRDGAATEPWFLLLRDVAHLIDTASMFVGWLWPLWDSRRRTFADMLLRTEVRRVESDARPATVRRMMSRTVTVKTDKARRDLGYAPEVSVEEGATKKPCHEVSCHNARALTCSRVWHAAKEL
jgi:Mce-associated membrane protein